MHGVITLDHPHPAAKKEPGDQEIDLGHFLKRRRRANFISCSNL
jgi:hypothetical protein